MNRLDKAKTFIGRTPYDLAGGGLPLILGLGHQPFDQLASYVEHRQVHIGHILMSILIMSGPDEDGVAVSCGFYSVLDDGEVACSVLLNVVNPGTGDPTKEHRKQRSNRDGVCDAHQFTGEFLVDLIAIALCPSLGRPKHLKRITWPVSET